MKKAIRTTLTVVVGFIGLLVVFGFIMTDEPVAVEKEAASEAYAMAKKFCKNHLKSPATAQFVSIRNESDKRTIAHRLFGMQKIYWAASGRVDSQNGFGALIRSDWSAVVEETDSQWSLTWLKIEDTEIGRYPERYTPPAKPKEEPKPTEPRPARRQNSDAGKTLDVDPQIVRAMQADQRSMQADQKAVEWQVKRAAEGSSSALFDLGMRYLEGRGVEKDENLGKQMIKNAAAKGYAFAIKKLKTLE